jgi:c-di-AMP phosphodiesterase-like protein
LYYHFLFDIISHQSSGSNPFKFCLGKEVPAIFYHLVEKYQVKTRLYLTLLLIFAVATYFLGGYARYLAVAEAVVAIAVAVFLQITSRKRSKELEEYIESMTSSLQTASTGTLTNFPIPAMIFRPDTTEILWANSHFIAASGSKRRLKDDRISALSPDFSSAWLLEGKTESPAPVEMNGRRYRVFGTIFRPERQPGRIMATTYWVDITDLAERYDEFLGSRAVCAIILLDNYDEFFKNTDEKEKTALLSAIYDKIDKWAKEGSGILCKLDRDRYLYIFEDRYIAKFAADKFSLLESVRESTTFGGLHATLSIGIGRDGESFEENYRFASMAIEMALSRGGDQAVIKSKANYEFYGGHSTEMEKRTKVKSRVMANAFGELISDATAVFVMGHRIADLDTVGAAAGVFCIARKRGKRAYIVLDTEKTVAGNLIARLRELPDYEDAFISAQDALLMADSKSLLVVVDTSRPEQVESESLLLSLNQLAVIDHHRRAATFIDNATLNFHEPYASSASELVVEMMQYLVDQSDILRVEAEALLAGIVLDTKSFAIRTGSRTFDAAAYLRRAGADTIEVKRLFQQDFDTTLERFALIQNARIYRNDIAIASSLKPEKRIIIAQTADELLNIEGIEASFVVSPDGENVNVSARSIGTVNVQLILEKLGGGGNQSTAGGQVMKSTVPEVLTRLKTAIDDYLASSGQAT